MLLVDADSLIFASCLKNKETIIDQEFYTYIEECQNKFDQQFMKIVNDLEELYDIQKVLVFNNSKGNFRKIITPKYKANRKKIEIPPLLNDMHEYVFNNYNGIQAFGVETDDLVASLWYKSSQNKDVYTVIVSIDKDYMQFPTTIYNYGKNEIYIISEIEAHRNFFTQMIVGDSADNIKGVKGSGKVAAKKLLEGLETKFAMIKAVYGLYKERYKSKAQIEYRRNYSLLKLRTDVK